MCAFFSKLFNVPTEPEPKEFRDPVFLIGLMRSGTTMLMNILSEHPQLLKVGFELNNVWSEIGGAPCSINCSERTEEHYKPEYGNNMSAYFARYIDESKRPIRHLARWSAKRFYRSGRVFYDWDNLYLLNKSPHLSNKIRYLNAMFPQAKFIVIVRDIYAQSASLKVHLNQYHENEKYYFELPVNTNNCWTNHINPDFKKIPKENVFPPDFSMIPEYWIRMHKVIFEHLKHIPQDQQLVFKYEDFLNERAAYLNRVFDFLHLESIHKKELAKIVDSSRIIQNTTTSGNPLTKWEKVLTQEEKQIIEGRVSANSHLISTFG